MPLPNPVRCTKKPRAKASSSSSKSKPRLPPDLQSRILLAFFDNLFDQGGIRVDEKLFQLSRLSLVCREWSAIVRPEYVKWVAFELRMKGMQRDGGKQPFDAEIIEAQLNNLRQARCLCCYSREGLRIALDNPSGTSLVARERIWKKALEKILVEYRKCPQFQLDLADAESGEYVDIIWRFIRALSPLSRSLSQTAENELTPGIRANRARETPHRRHSSSRTSKDSPSLAILFSQLFDHSHETRSLQSRHHQLARHLSSYEDCHASQYSLSN